MVISNAIVSAIVSALGLALVLILVVPTAHSRPLPFPLSAQGTPNSETPVAAMPRPQSGAREARDGLEPGVNALLAAIPIPDRLLPLTRTNALRTVLTAFSAFASHSAPSNDAVQALVVLPGPVDELHLIHRDAPPFSLRPSNLAEALALLTRHHPTLRVTVVDTMLLLHTAPEAASLPSAAGVGPTPNGGQLPPVRERGDGSFQWIDRPWPAVHPDLKRRLGRRVRPAADAPEALHFERVNLVGHRLSPNRLAQALAWATGTRVTITPREVRFDRPDLISPPGDR